MRAILAVVGIVVAAAAGYVILGQTSSGLQPWDSELSDNFVFARSIPFVLALGVAVGFLRRRGPAPERRADGAVRRFSPWTVAMHAVLTVGILLALPTGAWQYFGGILDVVAPVPLFWFYRIHYVGAAIVLFSVAAFLTAWWSTGESSLLVPRGAWRAHLRGLVDELPPAFGKRVARFLKVDMRLRPPARGRFSFYELVVSFPSWAFVLGLITLTGLVKAMRYAAPVPGPVLYVASTLHVAAMVLIGAKVLDHLRYTLARWPLMVAMATGWWKEPAAAAAPRPTSPSAPSPAPAGGD
ncbi:MAG: hypothetical protein KGN00_03975 [Chloroflexota bacterium]|nr:hypothetical protein [Chloroflexota bacterium]